VLHEKSTDPFTTFQSKSHVKILQKTKGRKGNATDVGGENNRDVRFKKTVMAEKRDGEKSSTIFCRFFTV